MPHWLCRKDLALLCGILCLFDFETGHIQSQLFLEQEPYRRQVQHHIQISNIIMYNFIFFAMQIVQTI